MGFGSDQTASLQVVSVFVQDGQAHGQFPMGRQFHQPDDPTMELLTQHSQGAKILVTGNYDPLLLLSRPKYFPVPRIAVPITDKIHLVTSRLKCSGQPHAGTGVHQ